VIPPKQEEVLRVFNLISKQQHYRLDRLLTAIYIVSQKKIVFLGRKTTIVKNFKQILVLAVKVSHYFDRC
jgi:hypothetical protein